MTCGSARLWDWSTRFIGSENGVSYRGLFFMIKDVSDDLRLRASFFDVVETAGLSRSEESIF